MGKSLIQPPIKINFYYGRYLSSGCVMDGLAFTPWQDDGLWMPAAPCRGRSRSSNADTRVIIALLATAREGGGKCRKGGGGVLYTNTCTFTSTPPHPTVLWRHWSKMMKGMKTTGTGHEQTDGKNKPRIMERVSILKTDSFFMACRRCKSPAYQCTKIYEAHFPLSFCRNVSPLCW